MFFQEKPTVTEVQRQLTPPPHLVDPVRVEHAQTPALAPDTLLGGGPLVDLVLELRDTLVLRLPVHNTLGHGALPATAADARAVDHKALRTCGDVRSDGTLGVWL